MKKRFTSILAATLISGFMVGCQASSDDKVLKKDKKEEVLNNTLESSVERTKFLLVANTINRLDSNFILREQDLKELGNSKKLKGEEKYDLILLTFELEDYDGSLAHILYNDYHTNEYAKKIMNEILLTKYVKSFSKDVMLKILNDKKISNDLKRFVVLSNDISKEDVGIVLDKNPGLVSEELLYRDEIPQKYLEVLYDKYYKGKGRSFFVNNFFDGKIRSIEFINLMKMKGEELDVTGTVFGADATYDLTRGKTDELNNKIWNVRLKYKKEYMKNAKRNDRIL